MSAHAFTPGKLGRIVSGSSSLAMPLATLALILLAGAPVGWRIGLFPLRVSFGLLAGAGLLGIAAAILAALGLFFTWGSLGRLRLVTLSFIVLLGIAFVGVAWHWRSNHPPPINDITTDTVDPPAIVTAVAARHAEHAVSEVYAGPAMAEQQKAAYPDVMPVILAIPTARAFDLALATAKAMPGWHIIASDPQAGRIEATQSSFWFGFVDDIVIRVAEEGASSRIDMRSHSRQGRGDLGVNATRIRSYMAALRRVTG